MTLILTQLSRYGIIHASDSNLSNVRGELVGIGKKVFQIHHLNAGLSLAGSYTVNNIPMNRWMEDFILEDMRIEDSSFKNFAERLKDRLENEMTISEKSMGLMIHIAGYTEINGIYHPEFWFVRNVHGIDNRTGEYTNINDKFNATEDFWTRDCPKNNLLEAFNKGMYQMYGNGFASGRIGFFMLQKTLNNFFLQIWSNTNWHFTPPKSLNQMEALIKLYIKIIGTLFEISDYPGPLIGGDIQTYTIPQPDNFVQSNNT